MLENAILFLAVFLFIFLRVLYMLATRKELEIESFYPEKEDWGTGEFIYPGGKSNLHQHNNTGG